MRQQEYIMEYKDGGSYSTTNPEVNERHTETSNRAAREFQRHLASMKALENKIPHKYSLPMGTLYTDERDAKVQSRRNIVSLYLIICEAYEQDPARLNTSWLDAKEQELARLKAKHLRSYNEEVRLTTRKLNSGVLPEGGSEAE